ncbi:MULTISPECIES: 4-(cytidine 5'-diphospho)-2-C-methyl-D-erythritol kinase [Mesorhizobium]|uniref:4-diphosphocytidyl-2-C-methyl-D-erythritol kinase n=1 Tax=Mesorhizobium denitrificans TaxID=2294114 RepID=A0A371XIK4_9HYPH|nr:MULTISPECIES: 4-(cytidine 5'-diphospho)-2-C-methyl-D-erythritol kinase [Mesorhizobium]RFC68884.1 4-(cytidine 5'-diphospho)-2-C-methyl-D-erythritol kinase [Mesorhizobium denitrificans]
MPETASPVVEDAPAKINLALHVTGKRPDGYHLLESLVVFTRLGDRLTATPGHDCFEISGPFGHGLRADESNLVIKARDAFPARPSVKLMLEKNLPLASGIGGGSSDASATLRALARLSGFAGDLFGIGAKLGADVPMCLAAKPLIAKGVGEMLAPVSGMPELAMVLVNPGVHVATPDVFRGLATIQNASLAPLPNRLDLPRLVAWLRESRNDLQATAERLAPAITETMAALQHTGPAFARMSGSGATCFGIYESASTAENAARTIRLSQPGWFVAATPTMT